MPLGHHLQSTGSISLAEALTPEQSAEGLAQLLQQLPHAAASDHLQREPLVEALQHQADRLQGQAAPASPLWQLAGGPPAALLAACCLAHLCAVTGAEDRQTWCDTRHLLLEQSREDVASAMPGSPAAGPVMHVRHLAAYPAGCRCASSAAADGEPGAPAIFWAGGRPCLRMVVRMVSHRHGHTAAAALCGLVCPPAGCTLPAAPPPRGAGTGAGHAWSGGEALCVLPLVASWRAEWPCIIPGFRVVPS